MSGEDEVQSMEVVESASRHEQVLVSSKTLVVSIESWQRETESYEVMKHVKVEDAATSCLVRLTVVVVTNQCYHDTSTTVQSTGPQMF